MKTRLTYIIKLYATILALFVIQKPMFLWLDRAENSSYGMADTLAVMAHGLLLDIPVTGYLIALPLLFVMASVWIPARLPLRRVASWYYMPVAVLMSLAFTADTSLYPFWKFKLDATIFYYIDSPKDAFASVSEWYLIIRAAAVAAYTAAIFIALRAATPRYIPTAAGISVRRKSAVTAALIITMLPLGISIRGGLGESTANIGKVYFSEDEYLNHSAVNPMFSMLYSLGKAENYADEFDYFDEHVRADIFTGLYPPTPTDTVTLLNTRRPNVLLILMESFGGRIVEAVGGNPDITPNYNRLAAEGVIFTHCYSNSFRTDRGMVSALSGHPAFPTLSVMKLPIKSRTLPCVANSLNAAGYRSTFLYGGDINFTNMLAFLKNAGFEHIVRDKDFSIAQRTSKWGAHDSDLFSRVIADLKTDTVSSPRLRVIQTSSSHEPFEVPYKSRFDNKKLNAFAFADSCIGDFVDSLRLSPRWDRSLVVIVPDHYGVYPENLSGEQQRHHIPLVMTGGALRLKGTVDTPASQTDIAATILEACGLGHSEFTYSNNILNPRSPHFAFYTSPSAMGFVTATDTVEYNLDSNRAVELRGEAAKRSLESAKAYLQTIYDNLADL